MHDDKDALGTSTDHSASRPSQTTFSDGTCHRDANKPANQLDWRLQRISDYLNAALSSPMPEVAVLGGINADLAALELRLSQSIEEILAECKNSREYIDAVPDGVEMMLKVSRQIERGTRLAKELARSQGTTELTSQSNNSVSALQPVGAEEEHRGPSCRTDDRPCA